MSKRRNISGGPLDVPLLDRVIEDGEVVEVPDFQPAHNPESKPGDPDYLAIEWPPGKWELVPKPTVAPEAKRVKAVAKPAELPAPAPEPDRVPAPDPAPQRVSSDPRER